MKCQSTAELFKGKVQTWQKCLLLCFHFIFVLVHNEFLTFYDFSIFLSDFHLQRGSGCQNDYVEIREGNSTGHLVGCFSGTNLPSNYTSLIGHILWIKFTSDASVSGAGFRAAFSHCECLQTVSLCVCYADFFQGCQFIWKWISLFCWSHQLNLIVPLRMYQLMC